MPSRISIISAVLNAKATITHAIHSALEQSLPPFEHIVIDGGSTDGSLETLQSFPHLKLYSGPDQGLYDALNKGIAHASGEIIGILHSDDVFANPHVLSVVAQAFKANPSVQVVYGDLVYVKDSKIVRYYKSGPFDPKLFFYGRVPAHPTLFVKKEIYDRFGGYKIDYKIAGDYEWILRVMLLGKVEWVYLPQVLVKMGVGGISTSGLKSLWLANQENLRACQENGIKMNWARLLLRYPYKIRGLLQAKLGLKNTS
ncbi:glycosyltransferase family 2 protein [Helicobacter bizzozeronii]|uniref:glycosyltransferase family 2 protein n=1 Tax=Helicobacter bizzozeronii TaxID=56877 RepID=UPI000CF17463|nr:glycosyltransferase family 2 protein [Helicobacter bizzozeronii]